jgi:RecB family exonuclease
VKILEVLSRELGDPRAVFVFPSEVAASFWLHRALALSERRAVSKRRFLSWDRFVETALDYGPRLRPVSWTERALFVAWLLEANRRETFLRQLVPPGQAAEPWAFARSLQAMLPSLDRLRNLTGVWPASSAGKGEDLRRLDREYRDFLRRGGLYEPAFEQPALRHSQSRFFLFYPEVLEEYPALERLLSASSQLTLFHLPPLGTSPEQPVGRAPAISAYPDSPEELRAVLAAIASLVDRGTDPEQIVITAAGLAELEPHLRRAAQLAEVPLSFRFGRQLTAFPPCRLFRRIQAVLDSRFSLPALRDLLLDRSCNWREEELGRALLRFGQACRIVANPPGEGDRWERCFARARGYSECRPLPVERLRPFYRRLKSALLEIAAAPSFRRLKEGLTQFSKTLLSAERWPEDELKAFQFALDTLDELEEASRSLGPPPPSAFLFWLEHLEDTRYVPREPPAGVAVYFYRVSAAIAPQHHFVINASQAATRHRLKPLPSLSAHEEESLGLAEHDLSDELLYLYSLSGTQVHFSYPRRGMGQSHLPPGFFVAHGAVLAASGQSGSNPYGAEAAAWAGRAVPPGPPLPLQRQGFLRARVTALSERGLDLASQPLESPELVREVSGRLRDERGRLRLSATGLELYLQCPLRFLLERVLWLGEEELKPAALEPMEFGQLMHQVFQLFYRWVRRREPGGRLAAERFQVYESRMRRIVRKVFRSWAQAHPLPISPVWRRERWRAGELAARFLEAELKEMKGERIRLTERRLRQAWPGQDLLLSGKIDRLSEGPEGLLLVDYKKNRTPGAADIFGPDAPSIQMPFYLRLMRARGLPVRRAAYYSIEAGVYRWVAGGPRSMADAETLERTLAELDTRIREAAARIAEGDFTRPSRRRGECAYCTHGETCRRRYALG